MWYIKLFLIQPVIFVMVMVMYLINRAYYSLMAVYSSVG